MGCDWYSVSYCEGEGVIYIYNGTVSGLYALFTKHNIDKKNLFIIKHKNYDEDSVMFVIGEVKEILNISMPGPYEITCDKNSYQMICEKKYNVDNIEKIKEHIKFLDSGSFKLITTCFETNFEPNYHDELNRDEKKLGLSLILENDMKNHIDNHIVEKMPQ
jgi:hypothetical protein